jgi:Zn finger protein HypA/HybF involved in hydrogenase expression
MIAPSECLDCGCRWAETIPLDLEKGVACPRCGSTNTGVLVSAQAYPSRDVIEGEKGRNQ